MCVQLTKVFGGQCNGYVTFQGAGYKFFRKKHDPHAAYRGQILTEFILKKMTKKKKNVLCLTQTQAHNYYII